MELNLNLILKCIKETGNIRINIQNSNKEYYKKLNKIKSILIQENKEINKIKDGHEEEFRMLNEKLLISYCEMNCISNEYNTLIDIFEDENNKFKNENHISDIEKLITLLENGIRYNKKLKVLNEKLSNMINEHLNVVQKIRNMIKQESE